MYNRDINQIIRNTDMPSEWHIWRDHNNNKSRRTKTSEKIQSATWFIFLSEKRDKTKKTIQDLTLRKYKSKTIYHYYVYICKQKTQLFHVDINQIIRNNGMLLEWHLWIKNRKGSKTETCQKIQSTTWFISFLKNPSLVSLKSNLKIFLFPKQQTCHVLRTALLSSSAARPRLFV